MHPNAHTASTHPTPILLLTILLSSCTTPRHTQLTQTHYTHTDTIHHHHTDTLHTHTTDTIILTIHPPEERRLQSTDGRSTSVDRKKNHKPTPDTTITYRSHHTTTTHTTHNNQTQHTNTQATNTTDTTTIRPPSPLQHLQSHITTITITITITLLIQVVYKIAKKRRKCNPL